MFKTLFLCYPPEKEIAEKKTSTNKNIIYVFAGCKLDEWQKNLQNVKKLWAHNN